MSAIGMTNAHRLMGENPIWINQFHWETVVIFVGLTFVTSATFILNQLIDVKSDSINQKLLVGLLYHNPKRHEKFLEKSI